MKNNCSKKLAFSLIELSIVILVVGILVVGITQGSRIIRQSKLSSAKALTTSSPVNSISGLALWLETTSDKSFDDNEEIDGGSGGNGTISNWYDLNPYSSNPLNLSQSTSSRKPTYITNGINGLPVLKFDGTSDYLIRNNVMGYNLSQPNQMTVFVVQRHHTPSSPTTNSNILMWQPLGCTNRIALTAVISTRRIFFNHPTCSETVTNAITNIENSPKIITALRRFDTIEDRVNGQLNISFPSITSEVNVGLSATLYVGEEAPSFNKYYKGEIGEIIIFNRALQNTEINSIESYLSTKWGIELI